MSGAENLQCDPGREFLIRWRTKNFSMFGTKENHSHISAIFVVPLLGNTKWYLKLLSKRPRESNIMCFLCRDKDGPEFIKAYYSISVCSFYNVDSQSFAKDSSCFFPGLVDQDKFIDDVDCGLSRDVLEVECRLWPDSGAAVPTPVGLYPVGIEMVSTISKQTRSLFSRVPNFGNFPDGKAVEFSVPSAGCCDSMLVCRLWMDQQMLRVLVRESESSQNSFVLKCEIHLLDVFRDRHLLRRSRTVINFGEDPSCKTMKFPLSLSKKQLMEKKDLYLSGDELLLQWELATSYNYNVFTSVFRSLYEQPPDLQVSRDLKWMMYLDRKYNEHRLLFRLLALLVVVLSVLPHFMFDNTP